MSSESTAVTNANDLINFIIDIDDEDCPEFGLHLAAYQGDLPMLKRMIEEHGDLINTRIRPFLSTPLRLAATGKFYLYAVRQNSLHIGLGGSQSSPCFPTKATNRAFI